MLLSSPLQGRGAKKLTLLYLANDVLQNSKKKGQEFNRDFRPVLPEAYKDAFKSVLLTYLNILFVSEIY